MNKWLWNVVFSYVPKFVLGQEKWKLGESKSEGLELYDKCLEIPCSCGKGNAMRPSSWETLVQQWMST